MHVTTLAPEDDPYHARAVFDRSKRRLDRRPSEGIDAALVDVIRGCDLVIVDLPASIARPLGIDAGAIARINPGAVYLAVPAFDDDFDSGGRIAGDAQVQAYGGIMAEQASYDGGPVLLTTPVCARSAGILGAAAALDALRRRAAGEAAPLVTVSQLAATLAIQTDRIITAPGVPDASRWAKRSPLGPFPAVHVYRARDDYLALACLTPRFWHHLCLALDHPEWISDPRFETAPLGIPDPAARDWLVAELGATFATRDRDEWLALLRDADVPAAKVLTREEQLEEPQARHAGIAVDVEVPGIGLTRQTAPPITFSRTPARIGVPPAAAPPVVVARGASGCIRVVDLAGYIAGAYCPTLLADLGCDVVKIEPPEGDPFRLTGLDFVGLNRGKRSIAVDLKRPEGRELVHRLVVAADVVVQNFRPGVAERLGVDYNTLAALNPRLVYAEITAYGPDGPRSQDPAFDQLMLAQSGIMRAQGAAGGEPVSLTQAVADFGGAMLLTFGIMAALAERARSGLGQRVETSLLRAAIAMQAGEFLFADRPLSRPAGGVDLRGTSAWRRCYRTADGWVFVEAATDGDRRALWSAAAPRAAGIDEPAAEAMLEVAFAAAGSADWLATLRGLGIPVQAVQSWDDLLRDGALWQRRWLSTDPDPARGHVTQLGNVLVPGAPPPRMAPRLGEHTRAILAEARLAPDDVARLLREGIVFEAGDSAAK